MVSNLLKHLTRNMSNEIRRFHVFNSIIKDKWVLFFFFKKRSGSERQNNVLLPMSCLYVLIRCSFLFKIVLNLSFEERVKLNFVEWKGFFLEDLLVLRPKFARCTMIWLEK